MKMRTIIFLLVCLILVADGVYTAMTNMEFLKLLIAGFAGLGLGYVVGRGRLDKVFNWLMGVE